MSLTSKLEHPANPVSRQGGPQLQPMETPHRVQLSRRKGWRMPANTVKVDRTTMWGNRTAHALGIKDRSEAVRYFEQWLNETASWAWKGRAKIELKGKNLACWCPLDGGPCHADVLLRFVNADEQNAPEKK